MEFKVGCRQYRRSIERTIGEETLFPQEKRLIFLSQLVSIFLSNIFDVLQSWRRL